MNKIKVDLGFDCKCNHNLGRNLIGRYVDGEIISSTLAISDPYNGYLAAVRKKSKGAALRQAKKADKLGVQCYRFNWDEWVDDIYEINTSMPTRSGGDMREWYSRPPEEIRCGIESQPTYCDVHWDIPYGVFYQDRLIAYIKLKRIKDIVQYNTILGHGDYLKYGIMHKLHFTVRRWLDHSDVKYIFYAAHNSGNEGLKRWKKNLLFQPTMMVQ